MLDASGQIDRSPAAPSREAGRVRAFDVGAEGKGPRVTFASAPTAAALSLHAEPSADALSRARGLLEGVYRVAGETHRVDPRIDWRANPSHDAEWLIAVHKLPMLVDLALAWRASRERRYLDCWVELTGAWLKQMGTGELSCSDAQVEAKRVEHAVLSLLLLHTSRGLELVPDSLLDTLCHRIADEAGYILSHLKPARNHRTFQLHAVVLAGLLIGPNLRAEARRAAAAAQAHTAKDLLCGNLLTDFGPDGVHCELSTHYHQITLETALTFVALCRSAHITLPEALHERLRAALHFSRWITLPDGEMALINDSDTGDHRPMLALGERLYRDARCCPAAAHHFEAAGYVVMRNDWANQALPGTDQHFFFDCAALGAGSHAHYDLFNFCWTVGGRQVVVDPGRYTYNAEPDADGIDWRHRFKRTAAHNTVCIDGKDQTRYLSKARRPAAGLHSLDRAARPPGGSKHGPAVQVLGPHIRLAGSTDVVLAAARSAEYEPVHARCVLFVARQYVIVIDQVRAENHAPHEATLHIQLAADWLHDVRSQSRGHGLALRAPGWQILVDAPKARLELGTAWVSKVYGEKSRAPHLGAHVVWSGYAAFATVLAPDTSALNITSLHAEFALDRAQLMVHGCSGITPFVDTCTLDWPTWVAPVAGDGKTQGAYRLERRQGGQRVELASWQEEAGTC